MSIHARPEVRIGKKQRVFIALRAQPFSDNRPVALRSRSAARIREFELHELHPARRVFLAGRGIRSCQSFRARQVGQEIALF